MAIALEQKELRMALAKALEYLPEKYRTILILREVQHLSTDETATILGLSEANVKTRPSRVRFHMSDAPAPGLDRAWIRKRATKIRGFRLRRVRHLPRSVVEGNRG